MVKIYGPMFSLDASGTLADAVTFSKWKGRPYVRERVIPSNPKSGAQVGRRAMFTFLTQEWDAFGTDDKATWKDLAEQLVASNFNAYVATNMGRWHNFLPPSQQHPALENDTPGVLTPANSTNKAVWEENRIKLNIKLTTQNQNWGVVIFASATPSFDTAVGNAIIATALPDTAVKYVYWTPPEVRTWHLDMRTFSLNGVLSDEFGKFQAYPP